jgi:membrane protein involved in colicin uptake
MFPDKGLSGVTLVTSFDVIRSRKDETRDQAQAQADTQTQEEAKAKARADALAAAKAKAEADVVAGGGAEALAAAKAKAEAAKKRVTAICVKGRVTKKVSALNPKCPIGYKRK